MNKLFLTDVLLVLITILGSLYLYLIDKISITYAIFIIIFYLLSKIIGYIILPYKNFEQFLNFLIDNSKYKYLSGFEIFKSSLILLLFIGFIFFDPSYWIIESILVVLMRIWGIGYLKNI
jgi:hypothetical protein